jgi:phosphinothricin acetyltransferase
VTAGAISIRRATEPDLPAILARTNEEIVTGFAHFGTEPIAIEGLADQFRRESARYPWLVALEHPGEVGEEERFLGFAKAGPWKSRGAYAWTVEIGVYVDVGARGRGVGRALYEALLPMLREAGFRTVIAGIALPNDASVRLHESIGMTRAGVLPQVGYKFGAWRDVGYWTLHWSDA